ncbi:MAG: hypothetical protein ACR2LC_04340 [Pyrinomonadaceae bacterium]
MPETLFDGNLYNRKTCSRGKTLDARKHFLVRRTTRSQLFRAYKKDAPVSSYTKNRHDILAYGVRRSSTRPRSIERRG